MCPFMSDDGFDTELFVVGRAPCACFTAYVASFCVVGQSPFPRPDRLSYSSFVCIANRTADYRLLIFSMTIEANVAEEAGAATVYV